MLSTSKLFYNPSTGVAAATTDPNFKSVPLLLKTGASATRSTVVTDSAQTPNTITRNANTSTGWTSPYQTDGYWSAGFGSGSSTYGYMVTQSNAAFQLTTSNFTIEFWAYTTDRLPSQGTFCRTDGGGTGFNGMLLGTSDGTNFLWYATSDGGSWNVINGGVICTIASVKNRWAHFAFVRSGSTFTAYVNGIQKYTTTSAASIYQAANSFRIGTANNANDVTNFGGFISNFRYVKGIAVYSGTSTSAANFTVPTSPLQATQSAGTNIAAITSTETQLLTCQSNRFKNNANNSLIIATIAGTVRVPFDWYPSGFTAPAASLGAAYFGSGAADYVSAPDTTALVLGSSNYTIELWAYPITTASPLSMISKGNASSLGTEFWSLEFTDASGGFSFYCGAYATSAMLASSTAATLNAWNHIAVVRNGLVHTLYLNGLSVATRTVASSYTVAAGGNLYVGTGWYTPATRIFPGYVSNARVVVGTAVYATAASGTQVFTPPSDFLTKTGGTYPSSTNVTTGFSATNTSLLLNFADSNYTSATDGVTNNTFIDTGPYAWPITRVGSATQGTFTPYWPDGYWGNYFGDFISNYLTVSSPAANFQFPGDFTIEMWYFAQSGAEFSIFYEFSSPNYFALNVNPSGNAFAIYLNSSGPTFSPTATIPLSQWNHIALVRSGSGSGNIKLYLNGTALATTATNTSTLGYSSPSFVRIGGGGSSQVGAILSNFRVVKGTPVYTGNFTPPTAPLTPIPNTTLLTCQSNRFVDNSSNALALALTGTPKVQAFQPFSPPASYSPAIHGASIYNTVKSDRLTATAPAALTTFTGDFTLECWVYPTDTSLSTTWAIMDTRSGNTANAMVWLLNGYTAGVGWNVQIFTGVANNFNTTKVPANAWSHIVLQRNGTTLRCFVNGIVDASTLTLSGTFAGTATSSIIINNSLNSDLGGYGNVGYTSNLRIVNGTAIYAITGFTPPTAPVTAVANTSLLLNYTNSGIYDASVENDFVTYGSAQASTSITKFSPTSIKFNGTTDYLAAPVIPQYSFGTGDFTVEGWFYFNAFSTDQCLIMLGTGAVTSTNYASWWLRYNPTSYTNAVLALYRYDGTETTNNFTLPTANYLIPNTWYHVACTRSGTSLRMYLNGVLVGTNTLTSTFSFGQVNATEPLQVGKVITGAGTFYYNGYMQDLRITKGYARYVTSFVVPSAALTPTATTAFLLKSDYATNAQQNNTFLDSSSNNFAITRVGTATQGSFTPYRSDGYWGTYLNGTTDYLSAPSTTAFAFGASVDFTVECWVYLTAYSSGGILGGALVGTTFSASSGWFINSGQDINTFRITTDASGTWSDIITATTGNGLPLNQWTHVAFVRNGSVLTLYKNGISVGSLSGASSYNFTSPGNTAYIGFAQSRYVPGYISNVRIVKGTAVYTGTFTPPTSPLAATQSAGTNIAAITGTSTTFLTCQSNRFKDNSNNNLVVTAAGTPKTQAFQPFIPATTYSPTTYGASAYFNGTSDVLTLATSQTPLALGNSDFTIEAWVYRTSGTGTATIVCGQSDLSTVGGSGYVFYISSTSTSDLYIGGAGFAITSPNPGLNTWAHVAWVRTGGTYSSYLNGTRVGNRTDLSTGSVNAGSTTYAPSIGAFTNLGSPFNGYISNLRFIKGSGGYNATSATITIPTAPVTSTGATTSLLANFANGAMYDAAGQNNLISVSTAQASTTITPKFGTTSVKFNGTSDYLQLPSNQTFALGSGPFAVEGWFYFSSVPTNAGLWQLASSAFPGTAGLAVSYVSGAFQIGYGATSIVTSIASGTITANTWIHIALVRNFANTLILYVNGIGYTAVASDTTNYSNTTVLVIGGYYATGYFMNGYIQDFKITRELAPVFTPPTTTFLTR